MQNHNLSLREHELIARSSGFGRPRPARSPTTFVAHVVAVTHLSPDLSEVVLHGGLDDFETGDGDESVYLMVRRAGGPDIPADHTMGAQTDDESTNTPLGADSTIRSWDPERRRLTLSIARDDHGAGVGGWVDRCEIGERVAFWGPRGSQREPGPRR